MAQSLEIVQGGVRNRGCVSVSLFVCFLSLQGHIGVRGRIQGSDSYRLEASSEEALNAIGAKRSLSVPRTAPASAGRWSRTRSVRRRSSETDCFQSAGRPGQVWVRFNQLIKAVARNLRPRCRGGRVCLQRGVASPVPRGPARFVVFL